MALINTLRERMGKIVVAVISLTMISFILLTDQSNLPFMGGGSNTVGEINGKDISYKDFQAKLDEMVSTYSINTNQSPQSEELERIREQVWQAFILNYAYGQVFNEAGILVTEKELIDMVQGENTHPHVYQMLGNPQTGEFDRDFIPAFLQNMDQAGPQQREAWMRFEQSLIPSRQLTRLDVLLDKTNYVTKAEARHEYQAQSGSITLEYVYVPYFSIPDSTVSVTEKDMQKYLDAHANEYQREESRDMKFVVFQLAPSKEDTALLKRDLDLVIAGLKTADNDSAFAALNTEGAFPYMTYRKESMPEVLFGNGKPLPIDSVIGPIVLQDRMVVYKMSGKKAGEENFVKGSHILIKWDNTTDAAKAEAKKKAEDVLKRARSGGDFAALAAEFSQDFSNSMRGGDLGYFGEKGNFVKEFKDAAFAHVGTGIIPKVVETEFGYHIIKIDEAKDNMMYKVAIIEREFLISDQTRNQIYRSADMFSSDAKDEKTFEAKANELGYEVLTRTRVGTKDKRIGNIENARNLVLWLYNDATEDKVSEVKEFDGGYVVAVMTGRQKKGTARLADVQDEIEVKARNEKKAKTVIDKLNALSNKPFEEIATAYGSDARNGESVVTLGSNSLTGVGIAPEAVGVAFGLNEGQISKAIETSNGVVMVRVISKTAPADLDDYSFYGQQLASRRVGRKIGVTNFPLTYFPVMVSQDMDEAIKEIAVIEDWRHKFF
jgi:peptidyl-prolyl cis-trans isomerase D